MNKSKNLAYYNLELIAILSLFAIVLVGPSPLASRENLFIVSETTNSIKEVVFSICLIVFGVFIAKRRQILRSVPPSVILVILLMWVSILWADDHYLSLRRTALTSSVIVLAFWAVAICGVTVSLRSLGLFLLILCVLNLLSSIWLVNGVHSAFERDQDLVGAWRGLHFHKNIAGPIAGMSVLIFLFLAKTRSKSAYWWLGVFVSVVFMIGARSLSAFVALAVSLIAYSIIMLYGRRTIILGILGAVLVIAIIPLLDVLLEGAVLGIQDESLSGRGLIWRVVLSDILQNWWLGYGYGVYWNVASGGFFGFSGDAWLAEVAHAHNGFLEVMAHIGILGLLAAVWAFYVMPVRRLFGGAVDRPLRCLFIGAFVYNIVLGIVEPTLLNRDRPEWFIYVFLVAVVCTEARSSRQRVRSRE